MTLLFVTTNSHKFESVSEVLKEFDIELKHAEADLIEFPSDSLKDIAVSKAKQAFHAFRQPLIVDDTGFYLEAYNNFPGTDAKKMFHALGLDGILKLISGKSRKAYFKTVICFIDGPNSFKCFESTINGKITKTPSTKGPIGLPYNKIFVPDGQKKVFAEIPAKERNAINHRGESARKLGKWLQDRALDDLVESI